MAKTKDKKELKPGHSTFKVRVTYVNGSSTLELPEGTALPPGISKKGLLAALSTGGRVVLYRTRKTKSPYRFELQNAHRDIVVSSEGEHRIPPRVYWCGGWYEGELTK